MKPYDNGQALTSCESLESKSILRVKNGGKAAKDKKLDLRIGEFSLCLLVSRVFFYYYMQYFLVIFEKWYIFILIFFPDDTEVTNILKDKTLLSGILNDIDCLAK